MRRHSRIERWSEPFPADPGRAELSGSTRARREEGDAHTRDRCRAHHRVRTGRGHRRYRRCRSDRACAHDTLQPTLAMARGGALRCACESTGPVSEVTAAAISRPFRHRPLNCGAVEKSIYAITARIRRLRLDWGP